MKSPARKLRVVVLMHRPMVPPENVEGYSEKELYEWKTEHDVVTTLRELGHEVRPLGVADELGPIRTVIRGLEAAHRLQPSRRVPRSPGFRPSRGQLPGADAGPLHRLPSARSDACPRQGALQEAARLSPPGRAAFAVFPRGRRVHRPKGLEFPLIVKSLVDEASLGISQASIVENDEKLRERVAFIHQRNGSDAIVEQYVEGREFYVGILGNLRLRVLPVWELLFENMPPGAAAIATAPTSSTIPSISAAEESSSSMPKIWNRRCATTSPAPPSASRSILDLDGYNRIDYRLGADGKLYFLEANPNPDIARSEEFASAAEEAGTAYPQLDPASRRPRSAAGRFTRLNGLSHSGTKVALRIPAP